MPSPLLSGTKLGRYEVRSQLGAGGMGEVYLAEDTNFWLQNEEDPDPAKSEQYARWCELRKLQEKSEATRSNSRQ